MNNENHSSTTNADPENDTQTTVPPNNNGPSLENPTWDFLFNNFNKLDLQKHCRRLGLTKIWTTKANLIDMILQAQRPPRAQEESDEGEEPEDPLQNIYRELREMREILRVKDAEIEELNILVKTANVTINRLSDRVTTLEEKVKENEINNRESPRMLQSSLAPEKTLFLGDSNLSDVISSDLHEDCLIRTLQGATLDLSRCWIREQLDWSPARCVLYCGIHDLMEENSPSSILDNLGYLITDLKAKNENIKIMVCELVPSLNDEDLDDKINLYNQKLCEWSSTNGISVIKLNSNFRLGTGEINELCYKADGVLLNRLGILRLLTTISKQCEYFKLAENWNSTVNNKNHSLHVTQARPNLSNGRNLSSRRNPSNNRFSDQTFRGGARDQQRGWIHVGGGPGGGSQYGVGAGTYNSDNQHRYSSTRTESDNNYHQTRQRNSRQSPITYTNQRRREGCYNCGERNHRSDMCRYDHKLRCTNCNQLGHKSKFCSYYFR